MCKSTVVAPSSHYTRTALLGNVQQLRDGARLIRECLHGDSETGGTLVQGACPPAEVSEPYRSVPLSSAVVGQSKSTDALALDSPATATTYCPAKPRVTSAVADQIVASYQAGATVADLAARYGFHRGCFALLGLWCIRVRRATRRLSASGGCGRKEKRSGRLCG